MSGLHDEKLARDLLFGMLRIRIIEETIAERYAEQEMRCPVHLCIGQEAVAVGACASLGREDTVMSGHRSHGHFLAKGGDLRAMMAEIYGRANGCSGGMGGSMHLVDLAAGFLGATPIVGSTIPIAVGTAFAARLMRESRVAMVFFGEGATEEGVFHEAVNFAVLKALPIVFVCENNLYSVYSPMSVRQPAGREVFQLVAGYGLPSEKADGNDVMAVHDLTRIAVDRARSGRGPTFLEFTTYRWREHCGPAYDNRLGYRTEDEFEAWKALCPIERFTGHVVGAGLLTVDEIDAMKHGLRREIHDAIEAARRSPFPSPERLLDNIYAD